MWGCNNMGSFPKKPRKGTKKQGNPRAAPSSFPRPLSAEDEKRYINLYKDGEGKEKSDAKNVLVESNLRLVAHIVKKYHHPDVDDLISIGTIGLIKGIASFDPGKEVRLATYCSRCIENAILTQRTSWCLKLEKVYLYMKNGAYFAA